MNLNVKTGATSNDSLDDFAATPDEQEILNIDGLTSWLDAGGDVIQKNGFRIRDKISNNLFTVRYLTPPVLTAGTNSKPCLQMGYGDSDFDGTDRGAIRPQFDVDMIAPSGFTVFSVVRVPTVASGDSATLGGYVWSSRGASSSETPGLNISGSTGRPIFRSGGATVSNPDGFDARDGEWHIIRNYHDLSTDTIGTNIDRDRADGTATGATVPPDSSVAGMLSPLIGGFLNTSGVLSSPYYGQIASILFFNRALTAGEIATVENYLSSEFGVTLV